MNKNAILIFVFSLFIVPLYYAQNASHNNVWTRLSFTIPFTNKIKTEAEFQKRFQNDITLSNSGNPFQENLMNSVRLWGHLKVNSKFIFSISPFAYFQHSSIITNTNEKLKNKTYEVRYTIAGDYKQKIKNNLTVFNRLGIEYRDLKNNGQDNIIRLRNKLGLKYDINKKWNVSIFDEYFANLNSTDQEHLFDHNRVGILGSFFASKSIKLDVGFIHISRLPKNKFEQLHDDNFVIMLYYTFNQNKK